jgi:pimeloyl-ACP methyl ester carboxylesterase
MTKMNKRSVLAIAALLVVGAVAAHFARPTLGLYYWEWRSAVKNLPYDGGTISYRDLGSGSPAVVIVSGMSVQKDSYYNLQKRLAEETRVVSFDRPGIGGSTPNIEPRTLPYIDKDLRRILQALKVPPPYLLVGHSFGGHIIRYYVRRHPGEVVGLVYLDAPHEDWPVYIRKTWSPEEVESYFKWWTPENKSYTGVRLEEMLAYETNCNLIRGVLSPPDVPALMLTGNNAGHFRKVSPGREEDRKNWAAMQASMLDGVRDKRHLVDWEVGHMMYQDKLDWVASEITTFIRKVRKGREARLNHPGAQSASPASEPAEAPSSRPLSAE